MAILEANCRADHTAGSQNSLTRKSFRAARSTGVWLPKMGVVRGNPRPRLKCLNCLRLEAGDSRLPDESPGTKGGQRDSRPCGAFSQSSFLGYVGASHPNRLWIKRERFEYA